jgi:large repetitive protein
MTFLGNAGQLRSAQRALLLALSTLAGVGFTGGATSLAQGTPAPQAYFKQNLIPPDVPKDVLIGETFKFKVRFKNTGTAIGYGPFIDLAINFNGADNNATSPILPFSPLDCDGIEFLSAKMMDVSPAPLALTGTPYGNTSAANCPAFNTPHLYPSVGQMTFPAGWQLATIELPFGSFDPSQPEIVVEVTAKVHEYADNNVPLEICTRGGFRFGASATGVTPILEPNATNNVSTINDVNTWECQTVTPRVFIFKKEYLGPEDETATGPNFKRKYKITLDIADGQTIKALTIKDCLFDGIVYEGGPPVVTATSLWPSFGWTPPSTTNCLEVTWGPIWVTGVAGPDATVVFEFSIRDKYVNGNDVLNENCDPVLLPNALTVTGNWQPQDARDTAGPIIGSNPNAHELYAKCLAIQKVVVGTPDLKYYGGIPGDIITFELNFQISDYRTIGNIVVTDYLSDGQKYVPSSATLTVQDRLGPQVSGNFVLGTNLFVTEQDPTFVCKEPLKVPQITGGTKLVFQVSNRMNALDSILRHNAGILTGGEAPSSAPTPAQGKIVFKAQIQDKYDLPKPSPDLFVDKYDPLTNCVKIQGDLFENQSLGFPPGSNVPPLFSSPATPSPVTVRDDSDVDGIINFDFLKMSVYAVKRGAGFICGPSTSLPGSPSPCPLPQAVPPDVRPGDQVTFRIEYKIPSGDAENLVIQDWLPLPVFDVDDPNGDGATGPTWTFISTSLLCPSTIVAIPGPGQAGCGPTNTAPVNSPATQFPLAAVAPQPGNSIQFTYGTDGTIFDTTNASKTIDLLFTLTVNAKPFADGLYLTNETQECEKNTFGITFCQTAIAQVKVREPKLSIRKSVIATNNPHGLFTQPASPQTMPFPTAQAPVGVTFGLAGVSGLIASPLGNLFHSDLSNVDANDLATFAIVIENQGGHPAFNVHLDDFIPWDKSTGQATCFEINFSTLSIKNGAGATITTPAGFSGANFGILFTSQIPALDASTPGANIIVITFQVKLLPNNKLKAGCCPNSTKLTHYTSTADPNAPNFVDAGIGGPFEDTAKVCVGPRAYAKCIKATSEAHTAPQQAMQGSQVPAAIGEIVRFRLITVIPEGTTKDFQIKDVLPPGLTYVGNPKAIFVANSPVTNPLGIHTVKPLSLVGVQCPGGPLPTDPISVSPSSFPFGMGTAPSFPDVPITITNNDSNDAAFEFFIIEFNAQVDNIATNQNNIAAPPDPPTPPTVLSNNFEAKYKDEAGNSFSSTSDPVYVKIVEPNLTIKKTADPTPVVQGGTVYYSVTITNTGTADAFDVQLTDTLSPGLTFNPPVTVTGNCLPIPVVSTGAPAVTCDRVPVNGTLTIVYQAVANPQTCPVTLWNQATVTWTSLPGPNGTVVNSTASSTGLPSGANGGERDGVTLPSSVNDYKAAATAPLMVNCP